MNMKTRGGYYRRIRRHREPIADATLGQPEEVAAVLEFLLSARAAYITEQLILPNGG